jgi:hypothetical protein
LKDENELDIDTEDAIDPEDTFGGLITAGIAFIGSLTSLIVHCTPHRDNTVVKRKGLALF